MPKGGVKGQPAKEVPWVSFWAPISETWSKEHGNFYWCRLKKEPQQKLLSLKNQEKANLAKQKTRL